jgi:hypothetical protein
VQAALLERALDLFRSNQRTRRIVHCDVSCVAIDTIQPSSNGILPALATGHNRANSFETGIGSDFSNFIVPLFTRDHDDFAYGTRALECTNCVSDHWFASNYGK